MKESSDQSENLLKWRVNYGNTAHRTCADLVQLNTFYVSLLYDFSALEM